jgi:hypothetical protein
MLSGEVKMPSIEDKYKKMETMLIMTPKDEDECYMVLIN